MGEATGISWTDHTWNPWHGCIKISPGCARCYMYREKIRYGQDPRQVVRSKTTFNAPLKWSNGRVFTCSWSDFFIEQADEWRGEAWDVIRRTPHLTYQILTKRPERILEHLPADWGKGWPNVWLGVSAEDQKHAEARIPQLLDVPAVVRFLSAEPLLGPIDLSFPIKVFECRECHFDGSTEFSKTCCHCSRLDWVIIGGESGPKARPMEIAWAYRLISQCKAADVKVFMKQIGARPKFSFPLHITGAGADPAEWPIQLRVQEFPG
jgi:protein gp37